MIQCNEQGNICISGNLDTITSDICGIVRAFRDLIENKSRLEKTEQDIQLLTIALTNTGILLLNEDERKLPISEQIKIMVNLFNVLI